MALLFGSAFAEPYRGDHHHAGARWHTVETRFFRIHYPSQGGAHAHDAEATALEVAAIADDLLLKLSAHLQAVPRGPIHVVVSDEAEGMTAWSMPSWGLIVLSTDPGGEVSRLRGRLDWVPDALAHELGHVVGHRRASPLAGSASYGAEAVGTAELGGLGVAVDLTVGPNEPYGWSEGAAESWSEHLGVNRWDARREARLRASAVEGRWLSWDEWAVGLDKDDVFDAERAYQQGYAFARWLRERHGADVFAELAVRAADRYPADWGRLFRRVTGTDPEVAFAEFRAERTADAVAATARARAEGVTQGAEVEGWLGGWDPRSTTAARDRFAVRSRRDQEEAREATGGLELWPKTSEDGRWFAEQKVGWLRVARVDEASLPELATTGTAVPSAWIPSARAAGYAFVPGRDALVLVAPEDLLAQRWAPRRADPWNQLFLVELAVQATPGGASVVSPDDPISRRRLVHPIPGTQRAREPAVSPSGDRLVFLERRDRTTSLVSCGLDGVDREVLREFDDGTWVQGPSFSPDGGSLVVSLFREDRGDLWIVDLADRSWRRLTDDARDELDPVWRADGIWASVEGDTAWDVVRFDAGSGRGTRMTRVLGTADTPWPTSGGDLLYAESGAWGSKSTVLRREDLLFGPDAPVELPAPRPPDRELVGAPRPYRPLGSVLVPAVGPLVRLDATEQGVVPAAGGWVHLRDAAELFDLSTFGLLGTTSVGDAILAWRGLPPELSVEASGAWSPSEARSVSTWSAAAGLRWSDAARLELRPARVISRGGLPSVTGERMIATLDLFDGPSGEPGWTGLGLSVVGTTAHSRSEGAHVGWQRAELSLRGAAPTSVRTGPLAEHHHTWSFSLDAGVTSADVPLAEELVAGGDLPGALRALALEVSAPLPGYAPFTLRGEHRVVAGTRWHLPIAPRLRTAVGPLYLRAVELSVGADAGNAWDVSLAPTSGAPLLADAVAEVRWWATLLDTRWDGGLRVGVPLEARPEPRMSLSLGAGF